MGIEIEAKIKVDDLDQFRNRLQDAGAEKVGTYLESNTFFDTEDRSLLAADEGLRLRINRDEATGTDENIVTYKGPRNHGQLKSREEIELQVTHPNAMIDIFERLRFHRVLTFEKKRESWKLADCKVEMDTLPHLGTYVEIEGPRDASVLAVRRQLGLADRHLITASYIAMLMTYLQENGITTRNIRMKD